MTFLRRRAGTVATLATVVLASMAPAAAIPPTADPRATTVTGACYGGPGRLSLTVLPPVAGEDIQVRATARGLTSGSPWIIGMESEDGSGREREFRRVAVDGRWTVRAQFQPPGEPQPAVFVVSAYQRGEPRSGCFVLTSTASPEGGLTTCDNPERLAIVVAREQDDGSVLIRSLLFGMRPGTAWHLTLAATGAGFRQGVEFDDYASRRGTVRSRVVMQGVDNPRLWLVARNDNGGRCVIGVNTANVATGEEAGLRDILRAGRRLR
jgi:hypothetical protein